MQGEDAELIANHQEPDEMSPYERLLGEALHGDPSLFTQVQSIEAQWRIVQPILGDTTSPFEYEPNTWGPAEADAMIEDFGGWANPTS